MKGLILAGGEKPNDELWKLIKEQSFDLVIGADAGSEVLLDNNMNIDYIIGDFDSSNLEKIKLIESKGTKSIKFKAEKDFTDSESAFNLAIEKGVDELILLSVTGTRLDHTLANLGLMYKGLQKGIKVTIYNNNNKMYMSNKSSKIKFEEGYKYISFLAYKNDIEKFSIKNAKYTLEDCYLKVEDGMTVSNEFINKSDIEIEFKDGIILVIHSKD